MTGKQDEKTDKAIEQWRAKLRPLFNSLPRDYREKSSALAMMRHAFHAELAAAFEPALNAHAQAMPQDSHEDKKALASWVNHELRQFGIGIRVPGTVKAAILVADVDTSKREPISRFRLESRDDHGARVRTNRSLNLPELGLIEDRVRHEPLSRRWARDKDGKSRGR